MIFRNLINFNQVGARSFKPEWPDPPFQSRRGQHVSSFEPNLTPVNSSKLISFSFPNFPLFRVQLAKGSTSSCSHPPPNLLDNSIENCTPILQLLMVHARYWTDAGWSSPELDKRHIIHCFRTLSSPVHFLPPTSLDEHSFNFLLMFVPSLPIQFPLPNSP